MWFEHRLAFRFVLGNVFGGYDDDAKRVVERLSRHGLFTRGCILGFAASDLQERLPLGRRAVTHHVLASVANICWDYGRLASRPVWLTRRVFSAVKLYAFVIHGSIDRLAQSLRIHLFNQPLECTK